MKDVSHGAKKVIMDQRTQSWTPDEFQRFYDGGKWGRDWVYARLHDGSLPSRRIGKRFVILRSDLIRDGWLVE